MVAHLIAGKQLRELKKSDQKKENEQEPHPPSSSKKNRDEP
jgi:hypothetical protein